MRTVVSLVSLCIFFLSISILSASASAADILVGPGQNTIQEAIAAANPGDVIIAQPGEYLLTKSIDFLGKDLTLRSEGRPEYTVLRMSAIPETASVVVFQNRESEQAVLEGFTITGGTGTLLDDLSGGGILCINGAHPTLRNLVVVENSATNGGALYCKNSSPRVSDCTFSRNRVRCGGGAYCLGSSPTFTDCTIEGNLGTYASSGIHSKGGSSPRINNCIFLGNSTFYGGAVDSFGGSPVVTNCVIAGNSAAHGGAAYVMGQSTLELINCTIWKNHARDGSGGIQWVDNPPVLKNCIILGNSPDPAVYSGSDCLEQGDPLFLAPGEFNFERFKGLSTAGGSVQIPDFIVEYPDLNPTPGSPAIDGGASQFAPEIDLAGRPRSCGSAVDIGAYEYCGSFRGPYRRGDVNHDGGQDISDVLAIVFHLFVGKPTELPCQVSADLNADEAVDIADAVAMLSYLFQNGVAPPEPFKSCRMDSPRGTLTCVDVPACN